MTLLILVVGAYLLGSVPAAYLVARWTRGIDLRKYGSGNLGSSNVVTAVSRRWGVVVILFDLTKGVLPVYVTRALGLGSIEQVIAGMAAIIGHNWSAFLRFQGGRGIMAIMGVSFMLAPNQTLAFLALALALGLMHQLALGTLIALVGLTLGSYFVPAQAGVTGAPLIVSLGYTAMLLLTVVRRVTVRRAAVAASLSTSEVFVNRLLFDRDIRDRDVWIHRAEADSARGGDRTS